MLGGVKTRDVKPALSPVFTSKLMDVSDMQGVTLCSTNISSPQLRRKRRGGSITASCYIKVGMIV